MDSHDSSPASNDVIVKLYDHSTSLNVWKQFLKFVRLEALLDQFCDSLELNAEPQVHCKRDRQGEIYFEVYSSTTGQRLTFNSEEDVREWFERQPIQPADPDPFRGITRR